MSKTTPSKSMRGMEPCVKHSCDMVKFCKKHSMACASYAGFVNSGTSNRPGVPSAAIHDKIFKEA